MSSFAGKFVFFYGDEGCQKGEIVEQIGDDIVLIRWDRMHGDPDAHDAALVCVGISEMITMYVDEMLPQWEFFLTREELEAQHMELHAADGSHRHGLDDIDDDEDKVPSATTVN